MATETVTEMATEMEQVMKKEKEKEEEEIPEETVTSQIVNINIRELAAWLTTATSNNKAFLLKPNDLRLLYTLMLWEYLSKHHNKAKAPTDDSDIAIPEEDLVKMIKLVFNDALYPCFHHVINM